MLYQRHNSKAGNYFECIKYRDFFFVPHIHRHPELIYVAAGEVTVDLGEKSETVSEGEYALILSNCRHGYKTPHFSEVYVCIFSEDYVPSAAKRLRGMLPRSIGFKCRDSVTDFALRELFREDKTPDYYILKAALYAVLGEFLSSAELEPIKNSSDEIIDRMIKYITENFTDDISLEKMAADLGYEKHYLSRCFNTKLKTGFSQYVNWYRVDLAKELLSDSALSVSEIAFRCGFSTIRSFNRVFLQLTGASPSEYALNVSRENKNRKKEP